MAYPRRLLWIIFVVGLCCSYAAATSTDCERPPHVDNASVELVDDESGDFVSVTYTCAAGYRLHGEAELFCDLGTEEWQGEPPACRAETTTTTTTTTTTAAPSSGQNRRRKANLRNVEEDTSIDAAFARQLDLSCVGRESGDPVRAPEIDNAAVSKYNRRKNDGNIFLVAYYECDDDFELETPEDDHLYCSKSTWIGSRPRCVGGNANGDYDDGGDDEDGGDDDDDGGDGDDDGEAEDNDTDRTNEARIDQTDDSDYKTSEDAEVPSSAVHLNAGETETTAAETTPQTMLNEKHENEIDTAVENDVQTNKAITSEVAQNSDDDNEKPNELVYESNDPIGLETTSTSSPELDIECSSCDHGCRMSYADAQNPNGRNECFCSAGFVLDADDGRTCHAIDKCSVDNGGCEQTCTNNPHGSVECSCEAGLQIDSSDGKSCIDINECLLRNGHGLCQDTCTNLWGSYRCSCNGLPGTRLSRDGHRCVDRRDCRVRNGGCAHKCVSNHGRVFCKCRKGFVIGSDLRTCTDIDECNDARTRQQCTHGCINMPGSYRCAQPPPASANEVYDEDETTEAERDDGGGGNDGDRKELDTLQRCPDGLRLSATGDECVDIDECAERQHGCDYCRNVFAGFECTCPAGYRLGDDGRTCRDVNECDISADDDGHNVATAAACSHDCHNTIGSYRCGCPAGFDLQADARTCVAARDVCVASDGAEHCSPGRCVATGATFRCECPDGYREKTKRCHDIDECSLNTHNCTHSCENTHGAFRCGCPKGLQLDVEGGHRCVDVDECASVDGEQLCDDEMECINTHGSYRCMCPEGAHLDAQSGRCVAAASGCALENGGCSHVCEGGTQATCACPHGMRLGEDERTCEIIHPCDVDNGGCSHECNRVDLSCGCPSGWRLIDEVGKQCGDVDECAADNGGCEQECVNEEGGFRCECETGFVRDSMHTDRCLDIDECAVENGGCSHQCVNEAGAYRCGCPDGYTLDVDSDVLCVDINECELRNGNCSHMCHNVPGSMHCACPAGDSLAADGRTCVPQNECDVGNGGCSHLCTLHDGRAVCSCPVGFELQSANTCVDIDECSTQNGGCESGCHNMDGSFECFCNEGYQLRRDGRTCEDIDECIENNGNCSNICLNLVGSHDCACETGYRLGADRRQCDDIDECREIQHGCSHECRNVNGSYECGCAEGWRASGHFECEDIDECGEEAGLRCVHGCVNTVGAFNCTCPDGHRLREDGISCEDIDECADDALHKCSHNCVNRVGSWECTCPAGFRLDSNDLYTCLDVDECADGQALCSHGCENVAGSYQCSCPAGYRLDDEGHTCTDIDECHFNNGGCSHECINEKGSFRCGCPAGHSLQPEGGLQCAADDLCSFANGGCQHECNVVDGGVQCSCPRGLVINRSDNSSCIDVDECGLTPAVCQHVCVNVVGSFQCRCHRGYRLNAQNQCVDVDECAVGNGGCAANSRCINLAGGFKCMCSPGFRLDKRSCVEIRDLCRPMARPENGNVMCSRSRHRTQLFYKTKCTFTCDLGHRMLGPEIVHCNGRGQWNSAESTTCVSDTCPIFEKPANGIITPSACLTSGMLPGERCILHCDSGYKPAERRIAICGPQLRWEQSTNLTCMAVPALAIKPYIRCPPDATLVLRPEQTTMMVRMERPRTNVDWLRNVVSDPAWGKQLGTYLEPGVHTVTFWARSSTSKATDMCRTVITVKEMRAPAVSNCPKNMHVMLSMGETAKKITWLEPSFHSNTPLKEVFKSKLPGESLAAGLHQIKYVAIDQDELRTNCEFNITVQSFFHPKQRIHHEGQRVNTGVVHQVLPAAVKHPRRPVKRPQQQLQPQLELGPKETYLLCKDQAQMKLDTSYPNKLQHGCVIKQVNLPSYNRIRRRHSTSNNMMQLYSTWDNQKKFTPQYRRQLD